MIITNFIRGGQIFLHQLRMFKQVLHSSLIASIVISFLGVGYLFLQNKDKGDWNAAITYAKASFLNKVDHIIPNNKSSTIDVFYSKGLFAKDVSVSQVVKDKRFIREYNILISSLIDACKKLLGLLIISILIIFGIWTRFGSKARGTEHTKGSKVLSSKEVASKLKKLNKASYLKIGDMPLVKDKETSHILITGTTGSGKSNCMHNLLPQFRDNNIPVIIVDFTGEMVARYFDEARGDAIINPFDDKAKTWDFWSEVKDKHNLSSISNSLFAAKGGNIDEMWNNASKIFFEDAVKSCLKQKSQSIKELYNILAVDSLSSVAKALKGSASSSMLDPKNEKTAMSIRTNTIAFIDWMEDFKETKNLISISDWIKESEAQKGRWLFLSSSPKQRNKLRNFHSMLLDLIINNLMELGPDFTRRIVLGIDELPSLKYVPSLSTGVSELRKYGICIIAGMQSISQMFEIYGQNLAYSMLDQFNTKFIFRTDDNNFANYICKNFGEVEYKESTENYSYGSHEMRDGVNFTKHEKKKLLVKPSDLASLEDLEAYVSLPEPSVRVARIKMDLKKA